MSSLLMHFYAFAEINLQNVIHHITEKKTFYMYVSHATSDAHHMTGAYNEAKYNSNHISIP